MANIVCGNCGYHGKPKTYVKGNGVMEIVLWLLMILPGLIYSVWRSTSRFKACPKCKSTELVPADSPKGKSLLAQYSSVLALSALLLTGCVTDEGDLYPENGVYTQAQGNEEITLTLNNPIYTLEMEQSASAGVTSPFIGYYKESGKYTIHGSDSITLSIKDVWTYAKKGGEIKDHCDSECLERNNESSRTIIIGSDGCLSEKRSTVKYCRQ